MRRLFVLAGAVSFVLAGSAAHAGVLAQADLLVTLNGVSAFASRTPAQGVSGVSTATSAVVFPGSAFSNVSTVLPIPSATSFITKVKATLGNNGRIGIGSGGVTVTAPLTGNAFLQNGYGTLLTIPLHIGAGSQAHPDLTTGSRLLSSSGRVVGKVLVTVAATGWHLGPVTATGLTVNGSSLQSVAGQGSMSLTSRGGGQVTLVTLARIHTSGLFQSTWAAPAYLTLTYTPEPGSLLLLGVGVAGLVAIGRRRRT